MSTLMEAVARARDARREAEEAFRNALVRAREAGASWGELAVVAELSRSGVAWLCGADKRSKKVRDGK